MRCEEAVSTDATRKRLLGGRMPEIYNDSAPATVRKEASVGDVGRGKKRMVELGVWGDVRSRCHENEKCKISSVVQRKSWSEFLNRRGEAALASDDDEWTLGALEGLDGGGAAGCGLSVKRPKKLQCRAGQTTKEYVNAAYCGCCWGYFVPEGFNTAAYFCPVASNELYL